MEAEIKEYILRIIEDVSQEVGIKLDKSSVKSIIRPDGKKHVKDATLAFFVDGIKKQNNIVLLVSNPLFPEAVREDIDRALSVAKMVDKKTANHIIKPLTTGSYGQQTYAVLPRLESISERTIFRIPQKMRFTPKVVSWLSNLSMQTKIYPTATADFSKYFVEPLQFICSDLDFPEKPRKLAAHCLDFVLNSHPDLFTVIEHGDFWIGNILFTRAMVPNIGALRGEFIVIDWGGSRYDGYPGADLTRFCSSIFNYNSNQPRKYISLYNEINGISSLEFCTYCMLSIGRLGLNLEEFPKERYYGLSQQIALFLDTHGLNKNLCD